MGGGHACGHRYAGEDPYKFSVEYVSKAHLPSADYALKLSDSELIAGVEKITRDNFFQQMKQVDALKAKLHELCESYPFRAVVHRIDLRRPHRL